MQIRCTCLTFRAGEKTRDGKKIGTSKFLKMSNQNEVLPKLLATSEFRALSNMGKAVKLVQEHNYSIRKAADLLNLKKSVLHRAIKLAMNGKSVQPTGRPPILNSSEKENVIRNINKNIDSKELTTYKQIRRMVI